MKFCFSKNIENIVGVLSFNKRFEGKNYVSTFIRDVSWIYFFFRKYKEFYQRLLLRWQTLFPSNARLCCLDSLMERNDQRKKRADRIFSCWSKVLQSAKFFWLMRSMTIYFFSQIITSMSNYVWGKFENTKGVGLNWGTVSVLFVENKVTPLKWGW